MSVNLTKDLTKLELVLSFWLVSTSFATFPSELLKLITKFTLINPIKFGIYPKSHEGYVTFKNNNQTVITKNSDKTVKRFVIGSINPIHLDTILSYYK